MSSPYQFLNKFNRLILPIMAPFLSGYILGYMVADADAHQRFQKYRPVHLNALPHHNFYVYVNNNDEYARCVEQLGAQPAKPSA
jgi:hypothetical protein